MHSYTTDAGKVKYGGQIRHFRTPVRMIRSRVTYRVYPFPMGQTSE